MRLAARNTLALLAIITATQASDPKKTVAQPPPLLERPSPPIARTADAAKPPEPPPRIDKKRWVPISATFGFVVTKDFQTSGLRIDGQAEERRTTLSEPKVTGYYVLRRQGIWCRVNIEPSDGAFAPLSIR